MSSLPRRGDVGDAGIFGRELDHITRVTRSLRDCERRERAMLSCRSALEMPMKVSRRIAVVAAREVKWLVAVAAMRAALPERIRNQRPSFRPLSEAETEAILGGELLAYEEMAACQRTAAPVARATC